MRCSTKIGCSDAAMALALLVLGILLCVLGAGLLAQWQDSAVHHQESSVEVLLAAAATAGGIGLLLWWVFSMVSAGASVLLERLGRHRSAAAARRLSPAFMRRAVAAVLSLQLLAGAAAHAATGTPGPEWTPTQPHSSAAPSNAARAVDSPTPGPSDDSVTNAPVQGVPPRGAPAVPESASAAWAPATTATLNPGWQPAPPVVEPGLLTTPHTRTIGGPVQAGRTTGGETEEVTVLGGDTLWDIVAAYLGPEASDVDIALEWPRWYAVNRELIGASPDVLLPGQTLKAPPAP